MGITENMTNIKKSKGRQTRKRTRGMVVIAKVFITMADRIMHRYLLSA